ncbi:MAG: 30S ribosomal protein S12 methylthiotransferase RimO [bacterium]|nr:30S ribosomal protein S12 methylthiotransferase RimO [bacterium]
MTKVALTSLGCARNLVDSELMLGLLRQENMVVCDDANEADVIIVNTCGFIREAVEESIDAILQLCRLKENGRPKKVIAVGCLVERYKEELVRELPEVDAFVGVNRMSEIGQVIREVLSGRRPVRLNGQPYAHGSESRFALTPKHFRYAKICEGCNHGCTFCAIPAIKGRLRSRSPVSILSEVARLIREGAREIVLIGQDTAEYGLDRDEPGALPRLLRDLCRIEGDFWVRLLYSCPTHFSDDLIDVIAEEKKICRYVDLPVQHIDAGILKSMGRKESPEDIFRLIRRIRNAVPGVTFRTSVIVGFPGEGENEFQRLLDFLKETRFERLGAFEFSPEEGTRAAAMPGQAPEEVKSERFGRLMRLQQEISLENNRKLLGRRERIIVDEWSEQADYRCVGRTEGDAPEVDGCVYVKGDAAKPGEFAEVEFTGCLEYDLIGNEVHEPSQ